VPGTIGPVLAAGGAFAGTIGFGVSEGLADWSVLGAAVFGGLG
jgi:hypothetical protein